MSKDSCCDILLIDDDKVLLNLAQHFLAGQNYDLVTEQHWDATTKDWIRNNKPRIIIIDKDLGNEDGLDLIPSLTKEFPLKPIILITTEGDPQIIVKAVKSGAFDFISKPFRKDEFLTYIKKALEYSDLLHSLSDKNKNKFISNAVDSTQYQGMVGASPQMRDIYHLIENVSNTTVNVMIAGESGTGKELIAKAIHQVSDRSQGPFVAINMASIPSSLIESTLFGHEKGSFTGADRQHIGAVEEAAGGTLFLDEITEMPIEVQPKLLRFIQEKSFRPVGANTDKNTNVRILSATNRDPVEEAQNGRFRMDLLYRLNVVPVKLPPLRNRGNDIMLIANATLKEFSKLYNKQFEYISPDVEQLFNQHPWPGNVRQLRHLIEQVVVLNNATTLQRDMIPEEFILTNFPFETNSNSGSSALETQTQHKPNFSANTTTPATLSQNPAENERIIPFTELEKQAIESAIRICKGSVTRAAKGLGISQATIYRKIKTYDIKKNAS